MTTAPAPKSYIAAIAPYVPGKSSGADGRAMVKLSANENPLGSSAKALAVLNAGGALTGSLYSDPDSTLLRRAIGAVHGIAPDCIVCGTGSGELLYLAAQAYAGVGDEILYVRYGFSLYDIAIRRCGATPVVAPDKDYATDIDALIACITPRTRVIFLANPNNPTGTMASAADIARLHAAVPPHVLLVLDQAYAEYLEPDADDGGMALAQWASNVLVTRTFSKIYGLAAERIGWATGDPDIIDSLNRIRGPFNVTSIGQVAGIAALADQGFVERARVHNTQWRGWLEAQIAALGNHGLRSIPAHGNFVLVLFEGDVSAESAYHGLMDAGYIVRWLPGQGLPHGLRITIGLEPDMRGLVAALRALLEAPA